MKIVVLVGGLSTERNVSFVTGYNVANALIRGYGIRRGAVAISVGHDSHNILTVGTNPRDMYLAVREIIQKDGGIVLADDGEILACLELPVAGLMSTLSAEEVAARMGRIREIAVTRLGVRDDIDPITSLCFMALPVIPELKLTDMGLFHVSRQCFIPLEV